ncbi:hypothetical protein Vau01_036440 [Virgisporangium aurantiacum]|uniref:Uncharacterized protein n=1 Tax=Virgisporangium aurantiacum TaxID=175570 RepID=A0A8J4E008_9ACTN|nr:hypothetical protein Vau01_036440 [Virgisporangium aurantiacum]
MVSAGRVAPGCRVRYPGVTRFPRNGRGCRPFGADRVPGNASIVAPDRNGVRNGGKG